MMGYTIRMEAKLRQLGIEPTVAMEKAIQYVDLDAGDELSDAIYELTKGEHEEGEARARAASAINSVIDKLQSTVRILTGKDDDGSLLGA
jgi:hypothetical protein